MARHSGSPLTPIFGKISECQFFRQTSLLPILWVWTMFYLVHAQNETCASVFQYATASDQPINITASCMKKPCITKCCPANQILFSDEPEDTTSCFYTRNLTLMYNVTGLDYLKIRVYKKNIKQRIFETAKTIEDFTLLYSSDLIDEDCSTEYAPNEDQVFYILENGNLATRQLNYFNQWTELLPEQFCVEQQILLNADGSVSKPRLIFRAVYYDDNKKAVVTKSTVVAYGLLVSCGFLLLVLAVYAVLPQLRNLAGIMLMAYAGTLTAAFICRAVEVLTSNNLDKTACIWLNFMLFYTSVASFTWMNGISFDIWWTMRGFSVLRHGRKDGMIKMAWYSLYGWGAPLLPVLFSVIVEPLDLRHLPDFVKLRYSDPGFCFGGDPFAKMLYMHSPILITTCINTTLFLMTVYNIWRIKLGVSQHMAEESKNNKHDENNFSAVYLKIALVMGINWIFEVVRMVYHPNSLWWYLSDVINSLIGLIIFWIFVCKRKVIVLLCKRFSIGNDFVRRWQTTDSKFSSRQETSRRKILTSSADTSEIDDFGAVSGKLAEKLDATFV